MSSVKIIVVGLGSLLLSAVCTAGSLSGAFNVVITLAPGQGMCVSETLNARAGVTVQVACRTGLFVDISMPAGHMGGHERVYRLPFGPGFYVVSDSAAVVEDRLEAGIITGLHIDRPDDSAVPLAMLVTF